MAKGPEAFRTISEASEELGVPPHVLRFWETRFSFVRPMKRAGGRRFYRRQDLDMLRGVRVLLHDEGYTIKGVQRLHRDGGVARVTAAGAGGAREAELEDAHADAAAIADAAEMEETPDTAVLQADLGDEERAPRLLLGDAARERLGRALDDLERARAAVDRVLRPPPPPGAQS